MRYELGVAAQSVMLLLMRRTSCGARASSVFLNDTTTSMPTRENMTYVTYMTRTFYSAIGGKSSGKRM